MSEQLRVQSLEVSFRTGFSVGPMDFSADAGIFHLEGANGSGKTTLLRAICGELQPSGGRVVVGGHDVHDSVEARKKIAFVPSAAELPEFLTVKEAYQFAASLRGSPGWDGAEYCRLLGLDQDLVLAHASAGQRRKAELVAALAADPAVLLLDETFAHLDSDSAEQLKDWVVDWSRTRVILLAHHGNPPTRVDEVLHVAPRSRVSTAH